MTTVLTPLPPAPSTSDPANFATKADALVAALNGLVTEFNAAASVEIGNASTVNNATYPTIDAAGDLIIGAGANAAGRLAIGAAGTQLESTGTTAAWKSLNAFSTHKNAVDQTGVVSGNITKIGWSTDEYANPDFGSDKFTPSVAGKYHFDIVLTFSAFVDTATALCYLYKNGAAYRVGAIAQAASTNSLGCSFSGFATANGTTDYFEVYVNHTCGTNETIAGASASTWFQGYRIGA